MTKRSRALLLTLTLLASLFVTPHAAASTNTTNPDAGSSDYPTKTTYVHGPHTCSGCWSYVWQGVRLSKSRSNSMYYNRKSPYIVGAAATASTICGAVPAGFGPASFGLRVACQIILTAFAVASYRAVVAAHSHNMCVEFRWYVLWKILSNKPVVANYCARAS